MTTLQDAPDPCGCHTSFAEHQLVTQESAIQDMSLPSTTELIGHQNGMEFGMVHISSGGPEMSPFVPILLFLAFVAAFIRQCSGATQYMTFRRLLSQTHQQTVPALIRENLILSIQSSLRRVRTHEIQGEIRCAYCKDGFTDKTEAFCCSECSTLHHRECYTRHCGCAVFGCRLSGSAN